MNKAQLAVLRALQGTQAFLDQHDALLAGNNLAEARKDVDRAEQRIRIARDDQSEAVEAMRSHTRTIHVRRQTLVRDHMRLVATIAQYRERELPHAYQLSAPPSVANVLTCVAAARSMANVAAKAKEVFVAAGAPSDFIEQLRTATDSLEEASAAHGSAVCKAKGATYAIADATRAGLQAMRVMHAIVIPRLRHDDKLFSAWQEATRVDRHRTEPPYATP